VLLLQPEPSQLLLPAILDLPWKPSVQPSSVQVARRNLLIVEPRADLSSDRRQVRHQSNDCDRAHLILGRLKDSAVSSRQNCSIYACSMFRAYKKTE
jgi:hypothetical protein